MGAGRKLRRRQGYRAPAGEPGDGPALPLPATCPDDGKGGVIGRRDQGSRSELLTGADVRAHLPWGLFVTGRQAVLPLGPAALPRGPARRWGPAAGPGHHNLTFWPLFIHFPFTREYRLRRQTVLAHHGLHADRLPGGLLTAAEET